MFRVTMSFGGKPVRKFTFDKPMIDIGRDATCDIVVENIGASRRHATIEKTAEGNYVLEDLKSHNGTFVRGEKVFHHQLAETDEFFIGKYAFQFEALEPVNAVVNAAAAPAPAAPLAADMTFRLDRKDIERIIGSSQRGSQTQLVQLAPEHEKKTLVLDKVYAMIGKHPSAEIQVGGLFAPAKAGLVIKGDHGFRLVALSPRLKVNGQHHEDGPLNDGDLISLGSRRWRFCQA